MYGLDEFTRDFPDDWSCLDWIMYERYGWLCPFCQEKLYRINGRRSYACSNKHHVSPTSHTIFHKSTTPLLDWFYAIYLISRYGDDITAKSLSRHLGVTYKAAWRMQDLIREQLEPGRRNRMIANAGVYKTANGRFRSRTKTGAKTVSIGTFSTLEEAQNAYRQAKLLLKTKRKFVTS